MKRSWSALAATVLATACGGAGGVTGLSSTNYDPVVFSTELSGFAQDYGEALLLPVVPPPSAGQALFSGTAAFDFTGDLVGTALADLSLSADFGAASVSGQIANARFDAGGSTAQQAAGELSVTGTIGASGFNAGASGNVGLELPSGPATLNATLALTGEFRGLTSAPTSTTGTVSGQFVDGPQRIDVTTGLFFADR